MHATRLTVICVLKLGVGINMFHTQVEHQIYLTVIEDLYSIGFNCEHWSPEHLKIAHRQAYEAGAPVRAFDLIVADHKSDHK